MGWNPEGGTLYSRLFDQCRAAFSIRDLSPASGHACYADPFGDAVYCHWISDDLDVRIFTPQACGRDRFPQSETALKNWLAGERLWNRTTGFLRVLRTVRPVSQRFSWIDLTAIEEAFALAVPIASTREARRAFDSLNSHDLWYSWQLRRDGNYNLVLTTEADPRSMRGTLLYQTRKFQLLSEKL